MNAVEIEEAISDLALESFDKSEFPFAFLRAFGNKETTIKRLRAGTTNKSDVGGVLQTNNIHIGVAEAGQVTQKLSELRKAQRQSGPKPGSSSRQMVQISKLKIWKRGNSCL